MTGHSPWDELAVGLALGALEPEDEQTFVGHLRGCSECAKTVADIEGVAGQLAYAVPADDPPPQLLESIMREVRASDRLVTPLARSQSELSRLRVPRRMNRPAGRQRASVRWDSSWLARAAVLIFVLALTGWNYQLRLDNKVKKTSIHNAAAFGSLLTTPGTTSVALKGMGTERATVLVNGEKGYLVVDNFAKNNAENSIYVLWAQKPTGGMYGLEKFKVAHDGPSYIPVRRALDGSSSIEAFAVSKESGSQIPPTPHEPIVLGKPAST